MVRVSYRRDGEKWIGVLREGRAVITECGHLHDNRDVSTTQAKAAQDCAREILDGARRPATADHVANRKRTVYQRVNMGAGFVPPAGWLDQLKDSNAQNAADYLTRVEVTRAALATETPAPKKTPPPAPEETVGDLPDWML